MSRRERRYQQKLAKRAGGKTARPASIAAGDASAAIRATLNTAIQHHGAGRLDEAEADYKKVLDLDPRQAVALHLLGVIAHLRGKSREAVSLIKQSLAINPKDPDAHNNLGNIYRDLKELDAAVACYRTALSLNPDHADAHTNLGNMYKDQGMLKEALVSYRTALGLKPNLANAHNNLGVVLESLGRLDEARGSFREALNINPHYTRAHSNLLLSSQYHPGISPDELKRLHVEWDQWHGAPLRKEWRGHVNAPDPEKCLRIGFVSPDLGLHPVGYFVVNLLEQNSEGKVEFICYSDRAPDDMTQRLIALADEWVDARGLSDQALAERIRADRIDILVDLAGHTAKNRLPVFARKPAPVQVAWAGYAGTTGLSAIDYLIADDRHIPQGMERHYTETVIRMPDGWVCYEPPAFAPSVGDPPFKKNGFVTFGCFNSPAKVNDTYIALCAEILGAVPNARMLIKYKGMDTEENRDRILGSFQAHGIDGARLTVEGGAPHKDMLAKYNEVDIALDTVPYAGGVTTCEALWMGVPVITLPGETFSSRHSLSHLTSVGALELAAADRREYVSKAEELANAPARLTNYRSRLRDQMARSPLCDAKKFTEDFTAVMQEIWRNWCSRADDQSPVTT